MKCGLCGLAIHEAETGLRYFGTWTAHTENRCVELLRLEIERMNKEFAALYDRFFAALPNDDWLTS